MIFHHQTKQHYFESLSETVTELHERIISDRIELEPTWSETVCANPINYNTHHNFDFPILTYKGKPTRKYFHVNIWRDERGTYELNCYVL